MTSAADDADDDDDAHENDDAEAEDEEEDAATAGSRATRWLEQPWRHCTFLHRLPTEIMIPPTGQAWGEQHAAHLVELRADGLAAEPHAHARQRPLDRVVVVVVVVVVASAPPAWPRESAERER